MEKAIRRLFATLTVVGLLAIVPAAYGQDAANPYQGVAGSTAGQVAGDKGDGKGTNGTSAESAAAQTTQPNNTSVLAFTGLDLALIAGGGFLLLAMGVGLSRFVARDPA